MSSAAQDEYDAFVARNTTPHLTSHPEDAELDTDSDDATLVSNMGSASLQQDARDHQTPSSPSSQRFKTSIRSSIRTLNDDNGQDEDEDDDDDEDDYHSSYHGTAAGRRGHSAYYLPHSSSTRGEGNTGPKGVISDARAFERERKSKVAGTGGRDFERTKLQTLPRAQELVTDVNGNHAGYKKGKTDNEDDQDETGFSWRQWKEKRLQELKATRAGRRGRPGGGVEFEGLERVNAMGYLDVLEGGRDRGVVAVFIFAEPPVRDRKGPYDYDDDDDLDEEEEDRVRLSRAYAKALAALSTKYSAVRFIALLADEAQMDPVAVPALLAYRGGDLFASLVPLREELQPDSSLASSMETCLKRYKVV